MSTPSSRRPPHCIRVLAACALCACADPAATPPRANAKHREAVHAVSATLTDAHKSAVANRGQEAHGPARTPERARALASQLLGTVLWDNEQYASTHDEAFFARFRDNQHAKVTVVACADSRFHTKAIDKSADDELFVIRNIGNQIDSTAGSVEYGVRHVRTPVLLIVGHVGCGAVKAAMGDYEPLPFVLRHEIDSLHLSI